MISHGRNVFIMREYIGNNSQLFDVRQYTLTDGSLEVSFPLGVSNEFCGREACVSVREGKLLLIWDQDAAQFDPHRQVI